MTILIFKKTIFIFTHSHYQCYSYVMQNNELWTSEHFFERIELFAKQKGYTLSRLSLESGLAESTLDSCRNFHRKPSTGTLLLVCDTLNISMSDFFSERENQVIDVVDVPAGTSEIIIKVHGK